MEVGRVVTNHERLFVKILCMIGRCLFSHSHRTDYDLWGGWKDIGEELQKRLALSLVNISWIALDNIDVECKVSLLSIPSFSHSEGIVECRLRSVA